MVGRKEGLKVTILQFYSLSTIFGAGYQTLQHYIAMKENKLREEWAENVSNSSIKITEVQL